MSKYVSVSRQLNTNSKAPGGRGLVGPLLVVREFRRASQEEEEAILDALVRLVKDKSNATCGAG